MSTIIVTAVVPDEILAIMGGTVWFLNVSTSPASLASCKQSHCQSRTSKLDIWILVSLPLFLSQDVCPPECPLSGAQLDRSLSAPGCGQYRASCSGCILDGEAVGATRLVHTQAVLLQQASHTLLADRPPGPGKTHTNMPAVTTGNIHLIYYL